MKDSCASSTKFIQYAAGNLFTDLAVEVSRYAIGTVKGILPTLRAWDSVTSSNGLVSTRDDGVEDVVSFIPDSQSLLSLLVIISRDDRCMRTDAECFYRLLSAFGPKVVTYGYLYRGPRDLYSDLLERVSRFHDELQKDLPRLARELSEITKSGVELDNKTSNKKHSKSPKKSKSRMSQNLKKIFFEGASS